MISNAPKTSSLMEQSNFIKEVVFVEKEDIITMIAAMRCRACRERVKALENDMQFKYSLLGRDIAVCDHILNEIERAEKKNG